MAERDITSVVWHERGHRIEVTYAEGDTDRLRGSEAVAVVLAKNAGLSAVAAPEGSRRWARHPDPT
jgi:hypothetical protein